MKAKLLLLLISLLLMCSCGDDVLDNFDNISLSATNMAIDANSGTSEIVIMANCAWTASSNASWLSVSPSTGVGDAVLNCTWSSNPETSERKATITVESANVKRTVTFVQSASDNATDNATDKPKVVSCCGVIGNLIDNENSYFEITFDQPITVTGLHMAQYLISTEPEYSNDFKTIRYTFNAAKLGLDLACQVQVRNKKGGVYSIDVTIPFYQKKYPVEGSLKYALLSEDKQSVWVTTGEPNKLLQLSLDDGQVIQDVDLPFVSRYICYNSYNNRIYVLPDNNINYLCVVNPLSGSIEETITFEPAPNAHPQYPTIYPYELQFTNDGFGIVLLHAGLTTEHEWRYLDSANHHKQTLSGYSWDDKTFEHVYRSYDGNKIWANIYPRNYTKIYNMCRNNPTPKEYQIHPKFQSDEYYAGGSMMNMKFSPISNKVFISTAPGSECVIDLDTDNYSKVITAEARDSEAGWDLTSNSRSLVYHVCTTDNLFLLLDMDKGEPIFFNYHIWYSKPCNVYHIPDTDQLMIAAGALYFFDASAMKQ